MKRFLLSIVFSVYQATFEIQSYIECIINDYRHDIWNWNWHRQYHDMFSHYRQDQSKRWAILNRYISVHKNIEKATIPENLESDMSLSDSSQSSQTMKGYLIRFCSIDGSNNNTQILDTPGDWYPIFSDMQCDLVIKAHKPNMMINFQMCYTTKNKTYTVGLLDVNKGEIIGSSKIGPSKDNTECNGMSFTITKMQCKKSYRFRLVHRIDKDGFVYVRLTNKLQAFVTFSNLKVKMYNILKKELQVRKV